MGSRVVLHVGLPKTGTTHLQGLLARNREWLDELDVSYPLPHPEAMFHAAVEVRGSADLFGLDPDTVRGSWERLARRAREHDGLTIISHEILAGASPTQIAGALDALAGCDVRVVITVRDLGRLASAFWQERVKLGEPWTFARLEAEQILPELDGALPAGAERSMFWHAFDFGEAAARWSEALGDPRRVSLAVTPGATAGPGVLWERFAEAAALPHAATELVASSADHDGPRPANTSLGVAQVALLRQVHEAVGDRFTARQRALLVKRFLGEQVLSRLEPSTRALTPSSLAEPFARVTDGWLARVEAAGHRVVGDVADLTPVCGGPGDRHPDDVSAAELAHLVPQVMGELLLEIGKAEKQARQVAQGTLRARVEHRARRGLAQRLPEPVRELARRVLRRR